MNKLWVRSQDGKKLVLAGEFEMFEAFDGVSIYANNLIVGKYRDIFKVQNYDEYCTKMFEQVKKDYGYGDIKKTWS